ncbi:hypothetical protein ACFLYP_02295 [Chloroflexota bacterium]
MNKLNIFFIAILILVISACGGQQPEPIMTPTAVPESLPGMLYVNPKMEMHQISPYVLGSNYGPWIAVPVEMLEDAYASGVTMLRFPGGEWGDRNDIKAYHIDAFMDFCEQLGADVNFTIRLLDSTPEEAAEMVRYVNKEMGYGVRYWTIGNEPTLYEDYIGETYDTKRFNTEWREFAEAMKDVDPSIILLGPELHQFNSNPDANPKDSFGLDWMTEFLKANGDLVDVVTFHRYPFPKNAGENATIVDLRQDAVEWTRTIEYLRGLIHEITGRDIPIAITEFNSHYTKSISGEGTPDSHYNAIWLADILGRMMQQNVVVANQWMLTSHGGQGGWGLVGRGELRPSYYVYQLYSQFGVEMVYSSSDMPDLRVYAALLGENELSFIVINMSDDELSYQLFVEGGALGEAEYWLFDADHNAENMGYIEILEEEVTFPAQSMILFSVSLP